MVAALAVLTPGSPAFLPGLLFPKATHEGKPASHWLAQLQSGPREARLAATLALGAIGADAAEAVPALAALLRDGDEEERAAAALTLLKMSPASAPAVPALAAALTDDGLGVRMNAATALARLGSAARAAIPALAVAIRDEANQTNLGRFHVTIQEQAAIALGRASAGSAEGVRPLTDILEGEHTEELRAAAARGLGEIGEQARVAIPLLTPLLAEPNPLLRESAENALRSLGADLKAHRAAAKSLAPRGGLPEEERAHIWKVENRGNELARHGFGPLARAIKEADAAALTAILAEGFSGTAPSGSPARQDRGFATVTRLRGGTSTPLGRAAFAARLLGIRKTFSSPPEVQFSLKALRPVERGKLDGAWEGVAQVRLSGEHRPGAPAEAIILFPFRLPALTREALSRPGWLAGADIAQLTEARATHRLFYEAAAKRGLRPERLHDNWTASWTAPMTGGVYVTDFDRDGVLDVLITDLKGCWLYRGKPGGGFEDVTAARGLPAEPAGHVAAWIDIDGDGWDDLILGGRVYRNEGGERFVDHTALCSLRIPPDAGGLVVADFDRDGRLDLYATRPGRPGGRSWLDPRTADPLGNRLFRNLGGWKFQDVTRAAGADGGRRSSFSAAVLDADDDGWPDLHVINEFGDGVLLVNNRDGTFRPTALAGRPADFGSMGVAAGDIDNDGRIDLYCANMFSKAGTRVLDALKPDAYRPAVMEKMRRFVAGSQLHLNRGGLKFDQAGERMGVAAVGWAYGACLADLDNDGWLDIYATAGFISRSRTEPDG